MTFFVASFLVVWCAKGGRFFVASSRPKIGVQVHARILFQILEEIKVKFSLSFLLMQNCQREWRKSQPGLLPPLSCPPLVLAKVKGNTKIQSNECQTKFEEAVEAFARPDFCTRHRIKALVDLYKIFISLRFRLCSSLWPLSMVMPYWSGVRLVVSSATVKELQCLLGRCNTLLYCTVIAPDMGSLIQLGSCMMSCRIRGFGLQLRSITMIEQRSHPCSEWTSWSTSTLQPRFGTWDTE